MDVLPTGAPGNRRLPTAHKRERGGGITCFLWDAATPLPGSPRRASAVTICNPLPSNVFPPGSAYCMLFIWYQLTSSSPWRLPNRMQLMSSKLLLAIPAAFLFSSLCLAQTGTIQGDTKGDDGKPLV